MIHTVTQKKIFIETYGCQMNEYDTELVKAILTKADYSFTNDELTADIVMLNTCAIREHAHRKVFGRIHEILHKRRTKDEGRGTSIVHHPSSIGKHRPIIGILGCMATNLRSELLENESLEIDFIAGPDSYKRLPQLIAECYAADAWATARVAPTNVGAGFTPARSTKPYDLTLSEFETYSDIYPQRGKGVNAWIAVSRGCNNFCTFCVVPYTRGRERSRSPENVVEEVKKLADEGFKQVTLLGQNVNSYRYEARDFAYLLEKVAEVKGIERVRFTSPHPKDFPENLLKTIATNPKLCKHVHLPLQAGNNRILELMNRSYTKEEFLALVDKTRELIPGVALSTDIIVGFCSETDAEFEDTIKALKRVEFDSAFTFKYSQRKQTAASKKFADDVSEEKKKARIMLLNDIQREITFKKNKAYIGKIEKLLLEDPTSADKIPDHMVGRTDSNKIVILPKGNYRQGDWLRAKINHATPHALKGEPIC